MRHVLVTGAAGFIGSHLVESLRQQDIQVTALDKRAMRGGVRADLLDVALEPLLSGVDAVFHLAGLPGVRPSWGPAFADYASNNVVATQRLAEACVTAGVPRLVVASSSSVYGDGHTGPRAEGDLPRPASPYGVSKLAAEQVALAYARSPESATSVVALRYFTVFGPRQRDDMLIGRVLRAAVHGEPLTIYGDGTQRRDFTFVGDIVAATISAGCARTGAAEVINVGGGATTTVWEVLKIASELTGRSIEPAYQPAHAGDVTETLADNAKAARLLDWRPTVDVAIGMARHLAWMTE